MPPVNPLAAAPSFKKPATVVKLVGENSTMLLGAVPVLLTVIRLKSVVVPAPLIVWFAAPLKTVRAVAPPMFISNVPLFVRLPPMLTMLPPSPAVLNVAPLPTITSPVTVRVRFVALLPNVSVPLAPPPTCSSASEAVFVSSVTVWPFAMQTTAPAPGTPLGDHVPAVFQRPVPALVFVHGANNIGSAVWALFGSVGCSCTTAAIPKNSLTESMNE